MPPQPSVIGELQSVNEKLSLTPSYLSSIDNKLATQSFDIRSIADNTFFTRLNTSTTNSLLGETNSKLDELISLSGNGGTGGPDPELNEKLDTLIQNTALAAHNTGATNDNVVSGTAAIGGKLDAIGQDLSDLTDAFDAGTGKQDGPALCTGDDCYKGKSWITPKYPDGLTSIYENHKLAFQQSDIHTYLQGFNPIISGAAPSEWRFCVDVGIANLGCHSLELPPYILSFVRLVILITAGFLCRRLIFGG